MALLLVLQIYDRFQDIIQITILFNFRTHDIFPSLSYASRITFVAPLSSSTLEQNNCLKIKKYSLNVKRCIVTF